MATPDLNPASQDAHDGELSPLGTLPQHVPASDPSGDAGWIAQQA
jgi:hypothetical protein